MLRVYLWKNKHKQTISNNAGRSWDASQDRTTAGYSGHQQLELSTARWIHHHQAIEMGLSKHLMRLYCI